MLHRHSVNCEPKCAGIDSCITKNSMNIEYCKKCPSNLHRTQFYINYRNLPMENTPISPLELIMARFCTSDFFLPSLKLEANLSQPLPTLLADFVGDVPLIGLKHVSSASLITTKEDFWKQVKGSQHCQAIKKIRSPHRSGRTHFVHFHSLIALLFPACAWRGREGDFNIVVKYLG